jgi:hypothetical protein
MVKKYTVQVAVQGVNFAKEENIGKAYSDELIMRPHFLSHEVIEDRNHGQILVTCVIEGLNPKSTGAGVAEEIFEVSSALLMHIAGTRVIILDVEPEKI